MNCDICEKIDTALPHTVNASRLGVSEATIRRHRQHMIDKGTDFFDIPTAIITSRSKTVRLNDGSYEKVTYNPAKAALLQAMSFEDVERQIAGFTYTPPSASRSTLSAHLLVADLQTGKVDGSGGTPELVERVMSSFYQAAELVKELQPAELFFHELGDVIENFYNTSSQRQTNDIPLTEQIRTARGLMIEGIKILAPLVPRLIYTAVPSNHCQVRVGPKAPASTPEDDFGIDLSHQIEDKFSDHPTFPNVSFVRPGPFSEALTVTTKAGLKVGAVHGHQAGSWHSLDRWWEGQSHGRLNGLHEADVLLAGHWHSHARYQSGDKRWVVVGSSSDNGSYWFSNKTGKVATSGMVFFTTQDELNLGSMVIL